MKPLETFERNLIQKPTGVKFLILLSLWFVSFSPIYPDLVSTWLHHSDNSHGILVPFISLYLIWRKREKCRLDQISSSRWGAVVLIMSLGLYILSYAGGIAVTARAMIISSLCGLVLFTLGWKFFKILSFPLMFLFFMVPVPDTLLSLVSFPLQLFATQVSTFIIDWLGIPAYREGNMVYFARTQLEIADACSGIRSIMSYCMLSFILAYMLDGSWWKRIVIVLSAIPLAVLANLVRIVGTGILAHFYGSRVALGFLHEFSGLVVFAFGFIVLFGEYLLLSGKKINVSKNG
jgi:exosortase